MRPILLAVILLSAAACSSTWKPDAPKYAFRIETPDSLHTIRDNLLRLYHRWGSGSFTSFTLSDSADVPLFINDSITYQHELFHANTDSVWFGSQVLHRPNTLLAFRDSRQVHVIAPSGIRPWLVFQVIDELCDELGSGEGAFAMLERNQPVVRMVRDQGRWTTKLNVYDERRLFDAQSIAQQAFFDFKGGVMEFDTAAMSSLMRRYPPADVSRFHPTICVYPDFETKARLHHSVMEYSFDFDANTIHIVKDRLASMRFREIVSEYFAYQIYGDRYPWLTLGLAIRNADSWFGKPLSWWSERRSLVRQCEITDLLGPKQDTQNTFVMGFLAVLFWESRTDTPEDVFRSAGSRIREFKPELGDFPSVRPPKDLLSSFKGVCYAHTNGVNSGYMSRKSAESLDELKAMGVNAISVTPFGYSQTDTSSQISFILDEMWDETLSGLYKVAGDAHDRGLRVMMKPHLWLGSGRWCGEIHVDENRLEDWERAYTRFITYHALIAELTGMESLCVGVELPHMTIHTDMWRRIIRQVRAAYDGRLTFGGNWNQEYEHIQFWDDLDFIGIQQYYPLADKDHWTEDEVRTRVRDLVFHFRDLGKKWNRPIVFTEVGFPSIKNALSSPHREDFAQPVSEEVQALGYQILIEEFGPMFFFDGFFWWKYESDEESRHRSSKSFTFKSKKAGRVVKEYYTK